MKLKDYKNLLIGFTKKIKGIDLNSFLENLKNLKIDDLKNLNYKRLFYDVRNSKYFKPTLGIFSASFISIFLLFPAIETINISFKKAKQYKSESENLLSKISELKNKSLKFEEIKIKMSEINTSFIKKDQIIFITQLLNETAKKSEVNINSFSPLLKADTSKLCKISTSQKRSKKFKSQPKTANSQKKGLLNVNYYEVTFKSDYLDIIEFLKEIQFYDVMISPLCLEVTSQQKSSISVPEKNKEKDSLIIPLTKNRQPVISYEDINKLNNSPDLGNVETKIIFKIPSFSK